MPHKYAAYFLFQVANARVSSVEWIAQFSADAEDDGVLNRLGATISQSLPETRTEFLINPLPK